MNTETFQFDDIKDVNELKPDDWDDITPHFEYYVKSPFCNPLKIVFDGKLAGVGTSISHRNTAWLAHIIVHKDFRNKGIGFRITKALLDKLVHKGIKTIYLVATELGYPVYLKAGFRIETEYVHFEGANLSNDSLSSSAVISYEEKFRNEILKLDRSVSGEYRELILSEHIKSSVIFFDRQKVKGVYFPTLKDGLIIASVPEAGIELMKFRVNTRDIAGIPVVNVIGQKFLSDNGFRQIKTSKRMIYGKLRKWKPANLYNRISGALG